MPHCIGIDYTAALEQNAGIGRYVRELTRALAHLDTVNSYQLFAAGAPRSTLPEPLAANFHWRTSVISPRNFARLWHRLRLQLPVETWTGPIDLFHAPDFTLAPVRRGVRTLLTVHDLSFFTRPETAHPGLRQFLEEVVPRSIRRADFVLADSEATKRDILHYVGGDPDRIAVLYSGVDERFCRVDDARLIAGVKHRYGIPEGPYVLSVGTVSPRKNFGALVRALEVSGIPHHLVIAGGSGWQVDPLFKAIDSTGMADRVIVTGFVDDQDLPALYSGADLFALPSLYEGFGLPVAEAMACGVPVITSTVSSLPEVAGDAALLVDPTDIGALADALQRLAFDLSLRSTCIDRGLTQSSKFTWTGAAQILHRIYIQLLES